MFLHITNNLLWKNCFHYFFSLVTGNFRHFFPPNLTIYLLRLGIARREVWTPPYPPTWSPLAPPRPSRSPGQKMDKGWPKMSSLLRLYSIHICCVPFILFIFSHKKAKLPEIKDYIYLGEMFKISSP